MTEACSHSAAAQPYQNAVSAERPASDPKRLEAAYTESGSDEVLNLREYWRVFVKRKWTILTPFIITVAITATSTFLMTPIFRATVVLQIDREAPQVVKFDAVLPFDMDGGQQFYQTQYELLKSRKMAERVIDQLDLVQHTAFKESHHFWAAWFGRQAPVPPADPISVKKRLVESFLSHLVVEPVRNSKLVKLHYDLPDPELAAGIANALAQAFIHFSLERRFDAASYAKDFLEQRLAQVTASLEDAEEKLAAFTRAQGIINVDERQTLAVQKFKALSEDLSEAEEERIGTESLYREALAAPGHGLTKVLDNQVINQLKQTQAKLEGEYQERLGIFKPDYPEMQQLRKRINEIQAHIDREISAIRGALQADYQAARRREQMLASKFAASKEEVLRLQDLGSRYNILLREADTNRSLYEGLLQRLKEVGVVTGVTMNNISVTDAAAVPNEKYKPKLGATILVGVLLGLLGGIGLGFLFEHLDDTLKFPEELERVGPLPVLGIIPKWSKVPGGEVALAAMTDPRSVIAEAFRSMRTAILFSTPFGAPKVLQFTSPTQGEGKTTAALNLAITFTQMDRKVLLIDCDLRRPGLHRYLESDISRGLTHYLTGEAKPAEVAHCTNLPNLFVIPAGTLPPNPAELLGSRAMLDLLALAAEKFDHVILDGPPTVGLADALILANVAQGTVIVVESAVTRRNQLVGAIKRLNSAKATILGGVLNKLSPRESAYSYYHSDYYYPIEPGSHASVSQIQPAPATQSAAFSEVQPPAFLHPSSKTLPDRESQERVESLLVSPKAAGAPVRASKPKRQPPRTVSKRSKVRSTKSAGLAEQELEPSRKRCRQR